LKERERGNQKDGNKSMGRKRKWRTRRKGKEGIRMERNESKHHNE